MWKFFRFFSWQKILFFLILSLVIYQSRLGNNQWLLGWDSVVPELDFKLNFTRAVAGAWQEYQGLGLAGGMAHLSDLTRIVILWVWHFAIPTEQLRWVWHMAMLVIGPVGVWWMGRKLWQWSESASLSASTFYLLNLATIQYYFVPYEAFSSFYGFLPWLVGTFVRYLESGKNRDLGKIILVGILATSAFYVQTLFIVYLLIIGLLSLGYLKYFKRVLVGLLTIIAINSFWLLPLLYSLWQGAGYVGMAKINRIGSAETALMNEAFGGWKDVSLLRGYWLQYIELIGTDRWGRLMPIWYSWTSQKYNEIIGLILFAISFFGTALGTTTKRIRLGWIIVFGLGFMMLSSFNSPLGFIYNWLVQNIPLFGEIFRSVFTKWSVAFALIIGVGVGTFVNYLKDKWLGGVLALLIVGGSVFITWPVFSNGIVFEKMKVEIPTSYANLFRFMNEKSNEVGRIAYLPADNMWSWKYSNWGYRGSGFLWYGMNQPIIDRAFDVWSPNNETFYNQLSTALYDGNNDGVENILHQYDVSYVILDESVISPGQDKDILRIDEAKNMAEDLGWSQIFHEGFLTVWDTGLGNVQLVSAPKTYVLAEGDAVKTRKNVIYESSGEYVSAISSMQGEAKFITTYPFADLMKEEIENVEYVDGVAILRSQQTSARANDGKPLQVKIPGWEIGNIVQINYQGGKPQPAYKINGVDGPRFLGKEKPEENRNYLLARISEGKEWSEYLEENEFDLQDVTIEVEVGGEPIVYDFAKDGKREVSNCDVLNRGTANKMGTKYIANERGSVCDFIAMKELNPRLSYLMRMRGEAIFGRSAKFFLYNTGSKRNDLEYLLSSGKYDQSFALLPWVYDGFYTLNINIQSFGQKTENIIEPVEVRYFPLNQIAKAKIVGNSISPVNNQLKVVEVKKWGTWLYQVKVEGGGLLKLSQGYDEGWISLGLKHVKVDGWANGWMIPSSGLATIFYWPQLLEYLGFVVLGLTILMLVVKRK